MAITKILIYQDLKDENLHGYRLEQHDPMPGHMLLKEQDIPGAFGFLPIYIRYIQFLWGEEVVLIISQSNYELSDIGRSKIVKGARKFLINLKRSSRSRTDHD